MFGAEDNPMKEENSIKRERQERSLVSKFSFPSVFTKHPTEMSAQDEARRRAVAAICHKAALRARLQSKGPSVKRTKMSKKLETCPGVHKVR